MPAKTVTPVSFAKTVTDAAVAEVLSASSVHVRGAIIQAKPGNTNATVIASSKALAEAGSGISLVPGASVELEAYTDEGADTRFDLGALWVDVSTNGNGVNVLYFV